MNAAMVDSFRASKVYALMFAATLFVMSWALLQPVYALYVQSLGATLVQLGLLLSLRSFLPLVLRIPLSIMGERIGRVRLMLIDMVIAVASAVFYSLASNFFHLIFIVLFESLASASFNQTTMSTVSDLSPPGRQGNTMGRYLTFLAIGMLGGPAICAVLVSYFSYSQLFLLSASFPLLGFLIVSLWSPEVPRLHLDDNGSPKVGILDSLRMIFGNRNVMLLSFCRLSFSVTQALFLALFSVYLDDLGISESSIALLFMVRGFSNSLARLPAGSLSDQIGRKKPMAFAFALLVVTYIVLAYAERPIIFGVALAMYGIGWGTRAVSEWALLTDLVEPEIKTISISYLSSIFGLGSTVGSMTAGVLAATLPMPMVFLLAAGVNLVAIPGILAIKNGKR